MPSVLPVGARLPFDAGGGSGRRSGERPDRRDLRDDSDVAAQGPRPDFDIPEAAQRRPRWSLLGGEAVLAGMTGAALASSVGLEALPVAAAAAGAALAVAGGWSWVRWRSSRRGRPDDVLSAVGSAVAQALQLPGQVMTAPDGEGRWRVSLDTTDAAAADRFARALREVLGPVDNPRVPDLAPAAQASGRSSGMRCRRSAAETGRGPPTSPPRGNATSPGQLCCSRAVRRGPGCWPRSRD